MQIWWLYVSPAIEKFSHVGVKGWGELGQGLKVKGGPLYVFPFSKMSPFAMSLLFQNVSFCNVSPFPTSVFLHYLSFSNSVTGGCDVSVEKKWRHPQKKNRDPKRRREKSVCPSKQ